MCRDKWELKAGGNYVVSRNNTTLHAFSVGHDVVDKGVNHFKIIGTHTDSPLLKIAPVSRKVGPCGWEEINVQIYGGGLWGSWFDRDLTFAGRVVYIDNETKKLSVKNWFHEKGLMRIPSLAPHLKTNKADYSFNVETHLKPLLCTQLVDNLFNTEEDEDGFEVLDSIKIVGENRFNMEKNNLKSLLKLMTKELGIHIS
jgi:aspartyl aminopeptidase